MKPAVALDQPFPPLLAWLEAHAVEYELHPHVPAFTARATAIAEGVDAETFAKVVAVGSSGGHSAILVLDATDQLDLQKAGRLLGTGEPRLLTEAELATLAPDCEVGAVPAVGALFGLPTFADYAVREDPEISFNAGSHRLSARVDRAAWERAGGVVYADLALRREGAPAWARE